MREPQLDQPGSGAAAAARVEAEAEDGISGSQSELQALARVVPYRRRLEHFIGSEAFADGDAEANADAEVDALGPGPSKAQQLIKENAEALDLRRADRRRDHDILSI